MHDQITEVPIGEGRRVPLPSKNAASRSVSDTYIEIKYRIHIMTSFFLFAYCKCNPITCLPSHLKYSWTGQLCLWAKLPWQIVLRSILPKEVYFKSRIQITCFLRAYESFANKSNNFAQNTWGNVCNFQAGGDSWRHRFSFKKYASSIRFRIIFKGNLR